MISAIINAAAPMMGGMSWPLVEAATSTAPAVTGVKPTFLIKGMVMAPVVTVFAMDDPEMEPMAQEATTAAFAGPPRYLPITAKERLIRYAPAPILSRKAPNRTKRNTKVADTLRGTPQSPSPDMKIWSTIRLTLKPRWASSPGR